MKKVDNILYADTNKCFVLGNEYVDIIDLDALLIDILEDTLKEVTVAVIYNEVFYLESKSYKDAVIELIRKKYSLDDELALIANSRIGNLKGEKDFLDWRLICKETAKKLFNE